METTTIKRKNIDLPVDTLQKLSIMAVSKSKSLKAYIEEILITKADSISVEVSSNPSPTNDEWFNDKRNIEMLEKGIADSKSGRIKACSMDEIKKALGV